MKRSFFQAAVTSILLYGCTTWTLTKRLEKKLDGNYTRMLRAILNKSWQQHPTRHQLYGHLPPTTKTIQVRRTRHAGHCWRSRDELIREEWRERVRDIRATSTIWWWWWWWWIPHSFLHRIGFTPFQEYLIYLVEIHLSYSKPHWWLYILIYVIINKFPVRNPIKYISISLFYFLGSTLLSIFPYHYS